MEVEDHVVVVGEEDHVVVVGALPPVVVEVVEDPSSVPKSLKSRSLTPTPCGAILPLNCKTLMTAG